VIEGTETCDDNNTVSLDGCNSSCMSEQGFYCNNTNLPSNCTSSCGNGLMNPLASEQCDDNNTISGEGCSATCSIELGYTCSGTEN